MTRKRKESPVIENVEVVDIGTEGKAVARIGDGFVVFVANTVPGDIIDLQILRKRSNYAEGRMVRLVQPSPDRVPPFCTHFGVCGGCKWQYLTYEKQLEFKQRQVAAQLAHIGKLELPEIMPIMASPQNRFYRNKLEFNFSNRRWLNRNELGTEPEQPNALGFHFPGMFDKIVDIRFCWLQPSPSNEVRDFIRDYALEHRLEFFDLRAQTGFLRNMFVRTSPFGNMLIMCFFRDDREPREALLQAVADRFPQLTSIVYIINDKANDTITDRDVHLFKGDDHIIDRMENLSFKIGPKSFYQTNPEQALEMYRVVRDFAGLTGRETVYDLYTGAGTIANFLAGQAAKIIGVDYVPEAIEDAKLNARFNHIEHALFFAGDMKDVLTADFIREHGAPDVLITDPPRAGMHPDVVNTILNAAPPRIVYVSCNPATQARDLAMMKDRYAVAKVQPVDMFPHTHHVENIVLLTRLNG
ncbi:MAG: 23S rRNA (uracil(1939)-C(5))-methyltransferase RlmD [Bacteroidales bacterium]|jgi:23S rRNA (uracil1939-C5)-methyltransferase|nr:23S rRNA (uracil(1939)-C(5))-methyltransferase RlmD [Bacteroidales bacterium]